MDEASSKHGTVAEVLAHVEANVRMRYADRSIKRVLVAFSGGIDSAVLLDVLNTLASRLNWELGVAHADHQLRGESSSSDALLAKTVSEQYGLPFFSEAMRVREAAEEQGVSLEMAGRELRHEFLARAATAGNYSAVALAHHADDQVELFFLRLLRGAGSEGLSGMGWANASPASAGVTLLRPLLDLNKAELCRYAVERQLRFNEDETNRHLEFQRNRIRHELLPLLKLQYQPALQSCILRAMDIISAESEFVLQEATRWLDSGVLDRKAFAELAPALQRQCLRLQLIQQGFQGDYDIVESLRVEPDREWMVGPGVCVSRDASGRLGIAKVELVGFQEAALTLEMNLSEGATEFGGAVIKWRILPAENGAVLPEKRNDRENFDADAIGSKVILRHWRAGDRFWPIGGVSETKLQDLFTNQKVPRTARHGLIVATTAEDVIFWVEGMRISERFKLTPQTKRVLHWHWNRNAAL